MLFRAHLCQRNNLCTSEILAFSLADSGRSANVVISTFINSMTFFFRLSFLIELERFINFRLTLVLNLIDSEVKELIIAIAHKILPNTGNAGNSIMMSRNTIQHLFNVNGLVAVITGGGSGLGLYAARALEANGAKVYIVGRREETLKKAASTGVHGNIKPIVGDVSDKSSLLAVADQVRKEQGFVNFLFANAGVSGPRARDYIPKLGKGEKPTIEELQKGLLEPDMDLYTNTFHVNATGVMYTAAAFLDLLAAGNEKHNVPQDSQILVTSSVAGFSRYLASSFAYSTSKAAANHTVKMLSTFMAQNGYHIRCMLHVPSNLSEYQH